MWNFWSSTTTGKLLISINGLYNTGKGINTIISLLCYYFQNYGLNTCHIHLYIDNYVGQSKKNAIKCQ